MHPKRERTEEMVKDSFSNSNVSGTLRVPISSGTRSVPDTLYRFDVFRYDAASGGPPRFQTYELEVNRQTSVLEGLLRIQDEQDPSLAFRSSCRGAVCGSCGMSINGRLNLACRVQLHLLAGRQVVLEPLPGLDVAKDLVVDMDPFWEKYERIQPWLHAEIARAEDGCMSESQRQRIDQFVNCILCGLCYAACPVTKSDERFTGPAALAKLYRFLADSRERRDGATLEQEDSPAGMWGCHTIMKCCDVCPKEVRPTDGIRGARRKLLSHKLKQVLPRNPRET
jgi:succinate dehydrogenase / fumarate reductase iron-sulfur subunit